MAESYDSNYDLRKRWAMMQLQNAGNSSPTTGIGALARALQGAIGGYVAGQAEQSDRQEMSNAISSHPAFGGGATVGSDGPAPVSPSPEARPLRLPLHLQRSPWRRLPIRYQ